MADDKANNEPIVAVDPNRSTGWNWRRLVSGNSATLIVVSIALGYSYWPTVQDLVVTWKSQPDYSHGFLVVPIALVILYQLWPSRDVDQPRVWFPGLAFVLVGLGLRSWFQGRGSVWSMNISLLVTLFGLGFSRLGPRAMRVAWPAFAFLVFLFPLPNQLNTALSQPLQAGATWASTKVLRLSGLWVMSEGNIIIVGGEPLEVAEACNGLSMLMSLAATVAATAAIIPMALGKRLILLASIIPIALLSNVLRISATAWAYHAFGAKVGGEYAHDLAGFLMMPLAMALVALELFIMSWLVIESSRESGPLFQPNFGQAGRPNLGEGQG